MAVVNHYPPGPVVAMPVASPTALAARSVAGLSNGQPTIVLAARTGGGPQVYYLQPAASTAPDSFFVIPTADDPLRQWALSLVLESQGGVFYTNELDLTAVATTVLIPPLDYRLQVTTAPQWVVSPTINGTITTGPRTSFGTDAGIVDVAASTIQTNLAGSPAAGLTVTSQGGVTNPGNLSLATNGLRISVIAGAVLGTATELKARLCLRVGFTRFT